MGQKAPVADAPAEPVEFKLPLPNKVPVVYSSTYNIGFWGLEKLHPFDSKKYEKIFNFLTESQDLTPQQFYEPLQKITDAQLRRVHSQKYLDSLSSSMNVARMLEVPPVALLPNFLVQSKALDPMRYATMGSLMAAELALHYGWGINLSGGYHHASGDRGGGFCIFADISLSVLHIHSRRPDITKFMIIDLDAHQGNGHERDRVNGVFGDLDMYIFDMYNSGIYPGDGHAKQGIDKDVLLRFHTNDQTYLDKLRASLLEALDAHKPQYIIYNAGTDCLIGDPLGALDITREGIIERDEFVFQSAFDRRVPISMLLSGGYQKNNALVIADSIQNLNRKLGLFQAALAQLRQTPQADPPPVGLAS